MDNLFQIILSSAVIVAVLNNIVAIYNHNKDSKLQHITSERSEWRKEIKNIALDIQKSNSKNIKSTLTELKVRINAYGQNSEGNYPEDDNLDFTKDEHLWKIISKIENMKDENEFEHNKTILINCLSCLLKFDWERSKEEVRSSKVSFISIFFLIISIVTYIGIGFTSIHDFKSESIGNELSDLLNLLVYLLIPYITIAIPNLLDIPKFLQTKDWYRNKHIKSYFIGFGFLIVIIISSYFLFKHKNAESVVILPIFEISYAIAILSCVSFYNEKKNIYINYDNSIFNILGIHKENTKKKTKVRA